MTAEERRLIRLLRNRFRDDDAVLGTLLDYLSGRGEDEPAKEPEPGWTPVVNERVRVRCNGMCGEVVGIRDGVRCAEVDIDGIPLVYHFNHLEPAPPEATGPTADEMLDWLAANKADLGYFNKGWGVHSPKVGEWLMEDDSDPRSAIRAAMKQEKP